MLQDRIASQNSQDYSHINQELNSYKKINHSLRKKLKEKDFKIQQLFSFIQDASKQYGLSPEPSLIKSHLYQERHQKLTLSDNRKKEKENKYSEHSKQNNIFKYPSFHAIGRIPKDEIHLPVLEKKAKNIFSQQSSPENPEKKGRVVRIPIEKLKPLDSEQVRKRFMLKYGRTEDGNE